MFSFDTTADPFLWMRLTGEVTAGDEDDYLKALARLEERRRPFGLISVVDIEKGEVSQETRRNQALWFKRNRERLAELCFGLVRVRPRVDPKQNDDNFVRAMPVPTQRVLTEQEALPILTLWLKEQAPRRAETQAS